MALTIHAGKGENSLFMTNENAAMRRAVEKEREGEGKRGTIYAGDIGLRPDSIQIKRQQAQKKAMKIMQDTFHSDQEIDRSMQEMSELSGKMQDQNAAYHEELGRIDTAREMLAENYGVEADSQENEDLALLRKERDAKNPASGIELSYTEEKRLEELHEAGLTEYQSNMLELDEQQKEYENRIAANEQGMEGIRQSLADTKIELLKSDPMLEAQQNAEDILAAANKEIFGDLMNEGKKHIDEKMAEEKEKADKRAEKKEEEEEKEAAREEQEAQMEAWIEGTKEAAESEGSELPNSRDLEQMSSYNGDEQPMTKAGKEIEEILDELKLIQDDLKGAAIDANL